MQLQVFFSYEKGFTFIVPKSEAYRQIWSYMEMENELYDHARSSNLIEYFTDKKWTLNVNNNYKFVNICFNLDNNDSKMSFLSVKNFKIKCNKFFNGDYKLKRDNERNMLIAYSKTNELELQLYLNVPITITEKFIR